MIILESGLTVLGGTVFLRLDLHIRSRRGDRNILELRLQHPSVKQINWQDNNFYYHYYKMKINFDELDETFNSTLAKSNSISNKYNYNAFNLFDSFSQPSVQLDQSEDGINNDHNQKFDDIDQSMITFVKKQLERDKMLEQSKVEEDNQIVFNEEREAKIHYGAKDLKSNKKQQQIQSNQQDRQQLINTGKRQILKQGLDRKLNQQSYREKNNLDVKNKHKKSMKWVYAYKKHSCGSKVTSQIQKQASEIMQATHQPFLYPNKYNQNQKKNKVASMLTKNYTVYDKLYKQANKREVKKMMKQEAQKEQNKQPKKLLINSKYFETHKKQYIPLEKRMHQVLEQKQRRKRALFEIDETTGNKMFEPDLSVSRESYRIFFQSLSQEKLKQTNKKSVKKQTLKPQRSKKNPKNFQIDKKTVDSIADFFYPEIQTQAPVQMIESKYDPYYSAGTKTLRKEEFDILQPFLHEIEAQQNKAMQVETNMSSTHFRSMMPSPKLSSSRMSHNIRIMDRKQFKQKLAKFYKGLTLHDKQILRRQIQIKKRESLKPYHNDSTQNINPHHPQINIRSSSLESISSRYNEQLYYI